MRLHSQWVFGLRQDFKQLIIGEKEKSTIEGGGDIAVVYRGEDSKSPREIEPLFLQVVIKTFLDLL